MESLADDLKTMVHTPLDESHVEAMRKAGEYREYREFQPGEFPIRIGDNIDTFWYVEDGEIEVVNPSTEARYGDATLGPGQYIGEISFFTGGRHMVGVRAVLQSRLIAVPRSSMLQLMSRIPELSDHVVTVFAARPLVDPRSIRFTSAMATKRDVPPDAARARCMFETIYIRAENFD